jgi:hypothetical protein
MTVTNPLAARTAHALWSLDVLAGRTNAAAVRSYKLISCTKCTGLGLNTINNYKNDRVAPAL